MNVHKSVDNSVYYRPLSMCQFIWHYALKKSVYFEFFFCLLFYMLYKQGEGSGKRKDICKRKDRMYIIVSILTVENWMDKI